MSNTMNDMFGIDRSMEMVGKAPDCHFSRAGLHPALGDRALSGLMAGFHNDIGRCPMLRDRALSGLSRTTVRLRPERLKSHREGCSPSLYMQLTESNQRAGLHPALGDRALSGLMDGFRNDIGRCPMLKDLALSGLSRLQPQLRPERLKSPREGCSPSRIGQFRQLRPERLKSPREGCSPSLIQGNEIHQHPQF